MRKFIVIYALLFCYVLVLPAQEREVKLKLVETSDIHGNFYPYNFVTQEEWSGSLARVHAYVQEQRKVYKDNLLLLDNGDILQGQPTTYYYNYMDTISTHLCASIMNYMGYVAGNMGNHDVETGHAVFNRWISDCKFPILGANIINKNTDAPYLKPYIIVKRKGVKVAILGMITPGIPVWLSENLWKGLRFDDMEETARYWMKVIREKENPDLVVGLFHSGQEAQVIGGKYNENASLSVATNVPGFDVVMMGHDHSRECKKIVNVVGDSVLIVNPAHNGIVVADVDVTFKLKNGKVKSKEITGTLTDVRKYGVSEAFMTEFASQHKTVHEFVSKKIGTFTEDLRTRQAYFGPSAFVDFIHSLQFDISKADISFSAPLAFDAFIAKGDVQVGDMFNLYKYENMLYVMKLSGKEIKGFLEMSYYIWTNQMKSPEDHLLWFKPVPLEGMGERASFQNFSFNFDSAAGIRYTVDVTKPQGEKVTIISMADGTPFHFDKIYNVVTNSYRGNGGGELLTKGAGIPQEQLKDRVIFSTTKDLRYYMIQYITEKKELNPRPLNQWKFIPEEWTIPASKRDYRYLFCTEPNKK
ncbi:5'-nucleotidase C-terminal domain-containing protein [Bacteroides sp.]|uniref:bifunctional metallophosphatase/5'-nucleotidase n=1 Tax=Bacteroides sp. TaxID=29523 RepID=UPI001B4C6973|nr:5'-nucleotidase C-terminal domain-containing protein [Bacteroides sp.]MBP6065427.1 5'-nucleotidase C-terminal domain-containing protein [Bacteroides sp.]MBP6067597.1 5'-nucleotidase C-terminal domain-containing protein [Bacteroides sp.]MBP6936595.1 5'-nucleotidase C-terminal domain-containing protein [Bacteroides sp.]MBP8621961.1 5'-nucleotidase C-terminal domain-containing protein [Bacteroides sp.]MBP9506892.1 5'-nucleotidase C-terminal domain-containing protein [Bacteroides sp.]